MQELTREQSVANKAWTMFNANLNAGLCWEDAKTETELDAEKMRIDWDQNFQVDEDDPIRSEKVWEKGMNKFDLLIQKIKSI